MKQSIHLLPKISDIDKIRKKYDPFYKKFKTHITLVYAFETKNQKELVNHINKSIEKIKPFEISFGKFYASNNFVCLEVIGRDCWKLYNNLNNGILAGFENKEVTFKPHVSIGVLETDEKAKQLAQLLNLKPISSKVKINSLFLLTFNDDFSIKSKKTFKL